MLMLLLLTVAAAGLAQVVSGRPGLIVLAVGLGGWVVVKYGRIAAETASKIRDLRREAEPGSPPAEPGA